MNVGVVVPPASTRERGGVRGNTASSHKALHNVINLAYGRRAPDNDPVVSSGPDIRAGWVRTQRMRLVIEGIISPHANY